MRYLYALFIEESDMSDVPPEEMAAGMARWEAFGKDAEEQGVFVAGDGLQPSAVATTIKVDGHVVSDGPFAETKEQLGGYYVLDVPDLDAAIEWGKKIPLQGGAIEIRPVMVFENEAGENMAGTGAA